MDVDQVVRSLDDARIGSIDDAPKEGCVSIKTSYNGKRRNNSYEERYYNVRLGPNAQSFFRRNSIVFYSNSQFPSNDFFFSELPNNKILNYNPNYLKTLIYKIGNDVNEHTFNLESLKSNYGVLMKYVNQYSKKETKTIKYEELTKENEIAYNDFKAFLQYRKEYLG